jgi:SAM-dependent methyltransferase
VAAVPSYDVPNLTSSAQYNARRVYLALRRCWSAMIIDRGRGIETSREVNLADLGLDAPGRVRYEPSGWMNLRRILRSKDVSPNDVFVDLGSGKGRVILEAARYPFRRVIGVEIAAQLTAVARLNVAACHDRARCGTIELVTADVVEYRLPADVTIAYLYNPFRAATFELFLTRLIDILDSDPRPFRLIYSTPMEHDQLMRSGRFRLIREARGLRPSRGWSRKLSIRMYEFEPRGSTNVHERAVGCST